MESPNQALPYECVVDPEGRVGCDALAHMIRKSLIPNTDASEFVLCEGCPVAKQLAKDPTAKKQ